MAEPSPKDHRGPRHDQADPPNILPDVASSVVHSVINYLSAIVSQAEMLKSQKGSQSEVAKRADSILTAALGGAALARRLSEYSNRTNVSAQRPLDLDTLIADHVDDRIDDAPEGVELVADLKAHAVFPADASKLLVMLDCLIDNAFEALDDAGRGGVVTISTRLDSRGWLELDVRDDGPGMEAGILERALEPFVSGKPDHYGLGLPLARSIWRRHRGAFSIEAPLGYGTLVRLTRPPEPY